MEVQSPRTFGKDNTKEVKFRIRETPTGRRESLVDCAVRYNPSYDKVDGTAILGKLKAGDEIEFDVSICGHTWTNRDGRTILFTDIIVVSPIVKMGGSPASAAPAIATPPPQMNGGEESFDEMPF